jgi:mevalonate kinase
MAGERIFHGNPSGIDSELAARSGLVRFVRGEPPEPISLRAPFELVIVPSGVPRSTAAQVEKVSQRIQQVPRLARPMLELLGTAVGSGIDSLMRNDFNTFGMILSMSHELLSGLGASSPTLDRLCAVALETGALGAKLTGAGGGGCIIALPSGPAQPLMDAFITHGERPLRLEVTP